MKLLVFEYSSTCIDNYLVSEGLCMLEKLLNDLENISYFDTYFLINESLDKFKFKNCKCIYLKEDLILWLKNNISKYDYCLFIAPEDNLIQYKITKIIEDEDVKLIGSSSEASFICSSKYLTYKNTPDDVLKIRTLKFNLENVDYDKIKSTFDSFEFIVKPDDKTSSSLIYRVFNRKEFENILELYNANNVYNFLIQEYIPGNPISVSVICSKKHINCISVNSQEIKYYNNNIEYVGCVTPIKHEAEKELFSLTRRILKNIPGLKGFCGVDYIIHEHDIYFVEVNARFTTPFIVLQKICDENLTEKIINNTLYNKTDKITFKEEGKFNKEW